MAHFLFEAQTAGERKRGDLIPRTDMSEAAQLAKEFSTPARKLIHSQDGTIIIDLSPIGKPHLLKIQELRFQHYFRNFFEKVISGELSLEEAMARASADANVTLEWTEKYLKSGRYKRWLKDRINELEAALGITPKSIALKHLQNIDGKIKLNLSQQASLSELGDRVWPKVQKIEHQVKADETYSMDELAKARDEVDALEKRLAAAQSETPKGAA